MAYSIYCYLLDVFIKVFKNCIPNKAIRHELKWKQERFFGQSLSYKVLPADEYIKRFEKNVPIYTLDNKKVYVFKDFFVSVNPGGTKSYIHDKNKNILLQSAPDSQYKLSFLTFPLNMKKRRVIILDEAVDLAIMFNNNYWHFTFTVLDKIINFEENGYKGLYIVPNVKYIKELLELTGINKERFIYPVGNETYSINKLHVINYMYPEYFKYGIKTNAFTMKKARDLVLSHINMSDIDKYPKKIYVKRIGTRKIRNEKEVEELLKRYNFKTIIPEDYSVEEQIKTFYAADIVICPHGANSTNALYMRPDTHFIECFGVNFIYPCMLDISKINKLNYHMLVERAANVGCAAPNAPGIYSKDYCCDYYVDIIHLDSLLYNLDEKISSCKTLEKIL